MAEPWSAHRLTELTGESKERLTWYATAGMLHADPDDPELFAADTLHRLRLIQHAHRRGISDEDLAVAIKDQGDLLNVFEELNTGGMLEQSLVEVARASGTPPRLLAELTDLLVVSDDDRATEEDAAAVDLLNQALQLGVPEEALIQLIRVFVECTGRLADAEVRIFHDHVHDQFRAQGLSGGDLLAATEAVGKPALGLVEPAVLYFHRRAYQKANREDLLRHLAEATTPPAATPGETTGTVMFVDLAGFTPLTVTLGDSGVAVVLQRFASIIRRSADTNAGRIIKQIGDAFMLVFDRPADAIRFGTTVVSECDVDPDLPPLHVGAHHGPLLYRDGDYFGNAVNLAARITSATDAGQFLISEDLAIAADASVDQLERVPPRPLKGVAHESALFAVRAAESGNQPLA